MRNAAQNFLLKAVFVRRQHLFFLVILWSRLFFQKRPELLLGHSQLHFGTAFFCVCMCFFNKKNTLPRGFHQKKTLCVILTLFHYKAL